MKTAILSGIKPVTALARIALQSVVVIAALSAGSLFAQPVVKTLGGGAVSGYSGYRDTNTLYALFHTPMGITVSQDGQTLFVADRDNNAVRLLTDFGDANNGYTFTFTTNFLSKPDGVVLDSSGNVYVLNRGTTNNATATNGTVLEFDTYGFFVATNASHLTNAQGITIDTLGDLYVTERSNLVVRITNSIVTTVAVVTNAGASLQGIAYMPNGSLAVCDSSRNGIYNINPVTGLVTTNAGFNGAGDGTGINNEGLPSWAAKFFQPMGVASAGDGTLIVDDFGNDRVKVITTSGIVTNFYGVSSNDWTSPFSGWVDGTVAVPDEPGGVASRCPQGVALSPDGTTVYTTEDYYDLIRKVTGQAFTPPPQPVPGVPTGLTATVITNQESYEVVLTWNPQSDATNFIVGRAGSSGGPFPAIANTPETTYTDDNVQNGATYYYVLQAENTGGISATSAPVSVIIPVPAPNPPNIGWYDFEGNTQTGFYSTLHPISAGDPYIANNPINIAIDCVDYTNGLTIKYITIPTFTNGTPESTITNLGSTPPFPYENGQLFGSTLVNPLPPLPLTNGTVTIEAVDINGVGEASSVSAATFIFQVGTPAVVGNNAAQFTLEDATTNVVFYYTLDGSDPTNAPASQQIPTTNGMATLSLNGSTNIIFQVRALGAGPDADFQMSGIAQLVFTPNTYVPNTISWGFARGECSSAFLGAAGETFIAPVTLTMLPASVVDSLQFNLVVTNGGPGVTNIGPPITAGDFGFQPMLMQLVPGSSPPAYAPIPPLMFANYETGFIPPQDIVTYNGTNFVSLEFTNNTENLLGVGWLERSGQTNLYDTLSQNLITYSIAHDDLFPNTNEPTGVIVGGYTFQIPASAAVGEQYQIRIGSPSATDNGIGNPGSAVNIVNPFETNALALGPGTLNAIKNVTVFSIPYLVGDVYNFRWFNAGDFGTGNLSTYGSANAAQVFETAVYAINEPPTNCDFYNAMDSCGAIGRYDGNLGDEFYGYYTNAGPMTLAQEQALFNGGNNLTNMDEIAFGDGTLDICDVYVTYVRSLDPQRTWFERVWTNGVLVATTTPNLATAVAIPSVSTSSGSAQVSLKGASQSEATSITNTPLVNFTAGDYLASAGQTITIPVDANTFGPYPLRMLMLNLNVVPLDGSPALTVPVQFTPNPALSSAIGSSTPAFTMQRGNGNYSGAWLPNSTVLPSDLSGLTGNANIGYLTVTIPTNANSMSSYAVNFGHASATPSGLASFPSKTFTGLITLSSRTNSYYNDGIPDSWRLRYFGTIYNELSVSNADADGTGLNNYQKYVAGLNPVDPTSVLNEGTDQPVATSQQDLVLYWPSVAGQTYIIERSPTLFPPQWTAISTNIGDGTYMEIHDTSGGNNRYYEVTTP